MAKKNYVIDTSVCLTDADCILRFQNNDVFIPLKVLEEIDKHKKRQDSVGFNARKIIKHFEKKGKKYLLLTKYNQYFCNIKKENRIFFVRDDEEYKVESEEKNTIHQLYKSGKLKLINDHEEPHMEPGDYFDEYFVIND